MKKSFMLIAAAAAMFAACQQEDVVIDQSSNLEKAIGFTTYTPSATRAENSSATKAIGLENYYGKFRVWGYKNIKQATGADSTYHSVTVFDGTSKDVVTWDDAATAPFDTYQWKYSPVRYWDKAATNYDFYAYAPATIETGYGTMAYQHNNSKYVNDATSPKTEKPSYFKLTGAKVTGESLPLNKKVTGNTITTTGKADDAFSIDQDYMIATDYHNYNVYGNPVNFHFNHILSRFNIGVKTTVAPKTEQVILKSVKVYNMSFDGNFDEHLVTTPDLEKGTTGRWTASDPTSPTAPFNEFGYPNTQVPLIGTTIADKYSDIEASEYKYVFQGLVIPQVVEKEENVALDGSSVSGTSKPYLTIEYSLNGEDFSYTYNLASLFMENIFYKDAQGRTAYKTTTDPVYSANGTAFFDGAGAAIGSTIIAYVDGTKYYQSDKTTPIYLHSDNKYYDDPDEDEGTEYAATVFISLLNGELVPVKRYEVTGETSIAFNEGWQNTLNIIISPVAILFDADVYEWVTNEEADVTVQ